MGQKYITKPATSGQLQHLFKINIDRHSNFWHDFYVFIIEWLSDKIAISKNLINFFFKKIKTYDYEHWSGDQINQKETFHHPV
jgi:hypothetical protein